MNKLIKFIKKWLGIYSYKELSINRNYFAEGFEKGLESEKNKKGVKNGRKFKK